MITISAKVDADSVSPDGRRLTTLLLPSSVSSPAEFLGGTIVSARALTLALIALAIGTLAPIQMAANAQLARRGP
jgi:hypothetical protein